MVEGVDAIVVGAGLGNLTAAETGQAWKTATGLSMDGSLHLHNTAAKGRLASVC